MKEAAAAGIEVEVVPKEVTNIENENKSVNHVRTGDGQLYKSNFTILTPGNQPNNLYPHLLGKTGYFPYHY
jgi:uncharacterized FAD-dependent dehydrogenase